MVATSNQYFNSHPHEEDDMPLGAMYKNKWLFQLTSSRRGWRPINSCLLFTRYFNSHPHEEDDHILRYTTRSSDYFNSHPHEEDDDAWSVLTRRRGIFQLTSSRRGWQYQAEIKRGKNVFQLTSSRRGWRTTSISLHLTHSISTHILTKRMTYSWHLKSVLTRYFNSHPHEEDDDPQNEFRDIVEISTHILTKRMTIAEHPVVMS